MADDTLLLGLDIGGTKCAAILGTAGGEVLERRQWASEVERGPEAMLEDLVRFGRELVAEAKGDVKAVGVSIGGPLDGRRGVVLSPPNLPGWDEVPLAEFLKLRFDLPCRIEHDAAACALAEWLFGAGLGLFRSDSLVYLTCGTGFGAGFVFGGRVHRGAGGRSPELGHVRLWEDGPVAFGKAGSCEAICAGSGIGRLANWMFPQRWPQVPAGPEVSALAQSGDAEAMAVLKRHASAVGQVAAGIGDALVPNVIVLGSLARHLGPAWLDQVRKSFVGELLPDLVPLVRLVPSPLGERLQDLSTLAAARGALEP